MKTRGILFDWDGVIIDSGRQHEASWKLLTGELGIELPEDFFVKTFGMRNQQIIPAYFPEVDARDVESIQGLADRKEELYRELLRRDGIVILPGVREMVEALWAAEIPYAVASSSPRINIDTVLEITGLKGFMAIISAEDVERGKPDPEVFLKAARALGLAAEDCVVVEDAGVGIVAGKAAGCRVLALTTTHGPEKLGLADAIWDDMKGRSPEDIFQAVG